MTEAEQLILEKLNTMEESMKMLLVNDVLKDAEILTEHKATITNKQDEAQRKIEDLQKAVKTKDSEIEKLKAQIETQSGRIQTLQSLTESKDRTIKTKDDRIQILQTQIQKLQQDVETKEATIQTMKKSVIVTQEKSNPPAKTSSTPNTSSYGCQDQLSEGTYYICPVRDSQKAVCFERHNPYSGTPALVKTNFKDNVVEMRLVRENNYYLIKNKMGNLLAIEGCAQDNQKIVFESNKKSKSQMWILEQIGSGYYKIVSAINPNYCVMYNGYSKLKLFSKGSYEEQKFLFKQV